MPALPTLTTAHSTLSNDTTQFAAEAQMSDTTRNDSTFDTEQPTPLHSGEQIPGSPLPASESAPDSGQPPVTANLIRGQTSAHRGLRTFAQDRLRDRRNLPS